MPQAEALAPCSPWTRGASHVQPPPCCATLACSRDPKGADGGLREAASCGFRRPRMPYFFLLQITEGFAAQHICAAATKRCIHTYNCAAADGNKAVLLRYKVNEDIHTAAQQQRTAPKPCCCATKSG